MKINLVIAVTDGDWFDMLRQQPNLAEVNFWAPSAANFRALQPGEMFLFKLHAPRNLIVGGGIFAYANALPCSLAWEAFREANGARSAQEMRARIARYRRADPGDRSDFEIGCRILTQPFFFAEADWIPVPASWAPNIVSFKTYNTGDADGLALWDAVNDRLNRSNYPGTTEAQARFGEPQLIRPRLGQGAFRVLVTDTYNRRCAITQERTLPALEAAHIRPYGDGGEHEARNGLLLRRDIHSLFDAGYVTVTPELRFEVSRRIREEFDNGRHYYDLHGKPIFEPANTLRRPDPEALRWHNDHAYRGSGVPMASDELDTLMRVAAFEHLRRLNEVHVHLTANELKPGFEFKGERIPLINPQRGIFKSQQMRFLLSIKTVFPKPGGKVWYDDQREVHRQIFEGDETIDYSFMGQNPDAADNRWLREAFENRVPIIYFLGVAPGRYQAMLPAFIAGWDGKALKARVAFGVPDQNALVPPENALERRYALRSVKQRLHQASFREAVITAYNGRCALSGLPEPLLLDAAHIVSDKDERLGQPVVPNGIPLSKIHHAAFDAHLIGIDPDFRLHVSERLMVQNDGPMLEALKRLNGGTVHLPVRNRDRPDRDRLAQRFERFRAAA